MRSADRADQFPTSTEDDHIIQLPTDRAAGDKDRKSSGRRWVRKLARRFPVIDVIREDIRTNGGLTRAGAQTVVFHRLANLVDSGAAPRVIGRPMGLLGIAGLHASRLVYGIELPAGVVLGRRVRIAHQSGIVIHPDVVIDDDVLIRQNVTIGLRGDDDEGRPHDVPHISRGVTVGAGAVVVGPIEVGPDAVIGANAVVTRDVPAGGKARAPRTEIAGAAGTSGGVSVVGD